MIKTILVTGSSGFIGNALSKVLLEKNFNIIGIDNHNDYYDPKLKDSRLSLIKNHINFSHYQVDLEDLNALENVFQSNQIDCVINLAAQAGVRYSIENPHVYIQSNIVGFLNILELSKIHSIKHLIYASSSSVYGANSQVPFSIHHNVDHPLSLYAATKKSNELMAHTYSSLFKLPTTGLRFFTVYGPYGRPDMALFKFTKSIINNQPIEVYNYGNHVRDFTYIDDITEAIRRLITMPAEPNASWDSNNPDPGTSFAPWRVFNIGNNHPINLMDYIEAIENELGKRAEKKLLPLQDGDVPNTFADVQDLYNTINFKPQTSYKVGVSNFIKWYLDYYKEQV